jgi:hypothetical protein
MLLQPRGSARGPSGISRRIHGTCDMVDRILEMLARRQASRKAQDETFRRRFAGAPAYRPDTPSAARARGEGNV